MLFPELAMVPALRPAPPRIRRRGHRPSHRMTRRGHHAPDAGPCRTGGRSAACHSARACSIATVSQADHGATTCSTHGNDWSTPATGYAGIVHGVRRAARLVPWTPLRLRGDGEPRRVPV